ncbi:MAG: hypothetical protein R6U02_00395 [Alkalibacterium sp.]|uniref:hypothetical protein n=1 Tax=Alkalibacterium sp. TaxID=1872447 RepID=UPI003970F5AD
MSKMPHGNRIRQGSNGKIIQKTKMTTEEKLEIADIITELYKLEQKRDELEQRLLKIYDERNDEPKTR